MSNDEIFGILNDMPCDSGWISTFDPIEFGRQIAAKQREFDAAICDRRAKSEPHIATRYMRLAETIRGEMRDA
jgi:hypothetical protein